MIVVHDNHERVLSESMMMMIHENHPQQINHIDNDDNHLLMNNNHNNIDNHFLFYIHNSKPMQKYYNNNHIYIIIKDKYYRTEDDYNINDLEFYLLLLYDVDIDYTNYSLINYKKRFERVDMQVILTRATVASLPQDSLVRWFQRSASAKAVCGLYWLNTDTAGTLDQCARARRIYVYITAAHPPQELELLISV